MKFFVACLAVVAVAAAQHAQEPVPVILKQAQDISPDGTYSYSYETENGISHSENGGLVTGPEGDQGTLAQGQYQYTAPDGTPIAVSYLADHNGYQPQGEHIPVAPPVPALIQRAIEYIQAHPPKDNQQ